MSTRFVVGADRGDVAEVRSTGGDSLEVGSGSSDMDGISGKRLEI